MTEPAVPGSGALLRAVVDAPSTVGRAVELLVVEDNPGDAALVGALLEEAAPGVHRLHRVARLAAAITHLETHVVDCVLLDLSLPDARDMEAPALLRAANPDVPIIVLTGRRDVAVTLGTVAEDYLIKGEVDGRLIGRAVGSAIERKRTAIEVAHRALHDGLTGLPNRTLLLDRLEQAIARLDRHGHRLAVLFFDLDRFKDVNDALGHDAGDRLLVAVAARLGGALRLMDTAARFGGDEFVVLCPEVEGEDEAVAVATRIAGALAEPLRVGGEELFVRASIGIALADTADTGAAALIRGADTAMYRAKEHGDGRAQVFHPGLHRRAVRRLVTESALRNAVERGELRVHYQPQVELATGRTASAEALVRWEHPVRGLLSPADFLDVAEESGFIHRLGAWVLHQACRQAAAWGGEIGVSVNLAPRELQHPGLAAKVALALEATGCTPTWLRLEIGETAALDDVATMVAVLADVKALGAGLALDNFGTGHASLQALQRFPFDVVKIDRSFVAELDHSASSSAIVTAVVALTHALGLSAVAEGVERAAQAERLRELGCDSGQGFFFGAPSPGAVLRPAASLSSW